MLGLIQVFTVQCTIKVFRYNLTSICSKSFLLDGRPQWEVEAKIIREKSQGVSSLCFSCTDIVQHFVCNTRTILNLFIYYLFILTYFSFLVLVVAFY